ncbi:MAG TPA: DNA primase [Solirubrobacteraceae bacterium]|jgi:DNA primase|nr:DNA primase [Solirubrobacteraceae bacterium]
MARYTQDSRERVRDAVDFEELVGARTELKRAGVRRLQGLCPFHDERTPSFGIDPVEKLYHCFGCGVGGDVFSFVMGTEGLDFAGALESLADRYGVKLEREAEDPATAARRERDDRLRALLERTAAYYVRVLWESPEAADARAYLASRGLEEGALREFRVGFSPAAFDRVLTASARAGYRDEELLACGLAAKRRDGRGLIDRFRGRIMFPLCDERGRVLGFGARALRPDDRPKYLNSSDNAVFHKGELLYGADLARGAAARAGRVVLVEGYTDAVALRQAGVAEVVGSMGTALTERQVSALARLAPTALFCQDPDTAGQEAVSRSVSALRDVNRARAGRGVEFKIVRLPGGSDPADVVQRDGADALRRLLDGAVPLARFEVERALERDETGTAEGRDRALEEAAAAIRPLPPSVLRDELVQLVAGRLGLTDSLLASALAGAPRTGGRRDSASRSPGPRGSAGWPGARPDSTALARSSAPANGARAALDRREQSERAFLALCLALPEEGEERLAAADLDELFSAPATRRAADYLRGRLRSPAGELPAGDEPLARLVAELVIRAGQLEATPPKLELEALQLDLHNLDRRIAAARSDGRETLPLATERQLVLDKIRHRLS